MGTNYFWIRDGAHVGRLDFRGHDRGFRFTWAEDPDDTRDRCIFLSRHEVIIDEHKTKYTGKEFLAVVDACVNHDKRLIGMRFD